MRYKSLYVIVLVGLTLLVFAALGNGILDRPINYSDWQYRAFRGICHQMPERSFAIREVPMAVNARCFGIFSGLWTGWLFVPLFVVSMKKLRWTGVLLSISMALHIIDFTAGHLSVWNSSNFSRFFLGIFLGIAVSCMIADQFKKSPTSRG